MGYNIKFSPPDMGEKEIEYVTEVLKSGWITTGPKTKELEKKLSEYIGTKKTVCLNSQTACAELALRLLEIGEGDEVIVPAYTYTASASVVVHVGATIKMVDIQPNKLEFDYDQLAEAITEKTKAVIPVDIAGVPCDYDKLFKVMEEKRGLFKAKKGDSLGARLQQAIGRIVVVEDAAHALGAVYKGKMLGQICDFTTFSFHAVKNFTTAEGGALTWNIPNLDSEEIYKQLQLLSLHGQSKDALSKDKAGAWEYDVVGPWYKYNMTDIMGAIGLAQLERYPAMLLRRREIIEKYDAAFRPLGIKTLEHYTDDYQSSGHLYITRLPFELEVNNEETGCVDNYLISGNPKRNEIIEKMAEEGIACNVHYKPLPLLTAYRKLGFDISDYPNAYNFYVNEMTLPLHTLLSDEEVEYVIQTIKNDEQSV